MKLFSSSICALSVGLPYASAITLDLNDTSSIKSAAATVAKDMVAWYTGDQPGGTPGMLPQPYYWWEAGAMFGSLIDYWYYTGDDQYNDITSTAILFQASPTDDFMPANETKQEGNDDQAFWGMAAMSAAELKFPDPPADSPQWLELAQGVFNSQAARWDNTSCGGGLKWQIFSFNTGYNYKNSISQGGFFNIAARLGAYTQNQTYFDWAEETYNWTESIGLISDISQVFDGSDDTLNCTQLDRVEWTYNNGIFLLGAAVMWNQTTGASQQLWHDRVAGLLQRNAVFFTNESIMYEVACEPTDICDTDQLSFKAYLARWMAATTKVAPWTYDLVKPLLEASAMGAAQSCSGGTDGNICGTKWYVTGWDGTYGPGQQMNALEVIQSNLITQVQGPVGNTTGGTSQGNAAAGSQSQSSTSADVPTSPVTTADKAGAGILTAVILLGFLGTASWMVI